MDNKNLQLNEKKNHFKNAILFGIYAILAGYIANLIVRPFLKIKLPDVCKTWNKHHVMEASLFLVGITLYYIKITGAKPRR